MSPASRLQVTFDRGPAAGCPYRHHPTPTTHQAFGQKKGVVADLLSARSLPLSGLLAQRQKRGNWAIPLGASGKPHETSGVPPAGATLPRRARCHTHAI